MPTTFLTDTFVGGNVDLNAHTPDSGGSWSRVPGYTGNSLFIDSTFSVCYLAGRSTSAPGYYEHSEIASGDKTVTTAGFALGGISTSTCAILARTNGETGYYAEVTYDGVAAKIYRVNAGSYALLGTYSISSSPLTSTYKNMVFTVEGTNPVLLTLSWDGTALVTGLADSSGSRVTAAGKTSIYLLGYGQCTSVVATYEGASVLIKKLRVPATAYADGTVRNLMVFDSPARTGYFAPLNSSVTASGGYFKLNNSGITVGSKYPGFLSSFGANDTVDALGAAIWAEGIEE